MRRRPLVIALGAGALLVGLLPSQLVHASGAKTRYVSTLGTDTGNCTVRADACATVTYAVEQANPGDTIKLTAGKYFQQAEINKSVTVEGAGVNSQGTELAAPSTLVANTQTSAPGGAGETSIVDIDGDATVTLTELIIAGPGPVQTSVDCNAADSDVLASGIDVWGGATARITKVNVLNIFDTPANNCGVGDGISVGSGCATCTADTGTAVLTGVTVSGFQHAGVAVSGLNSTLTVMPPTKKVAATQVLNTPNANVATNGIEVDNSAFASVAGAKISGNICTAVSCGAPYVSDLFDSGTTDPFTSDSSTTFSATGSSDSTATWTANQYVGDAVTDGSSSGVIASNDTTGDVTLTSAGWAGGTPASASVFTIVTPSYGTTNVTDTAATTWTTNEFAGDTVTSGGNTDVVKSNTATVLTLDHAWVGVTPSQGTGFSIITVVTPAAGFGVYLNQAAGSVQIKNDTITGNDGGVYDNTGEIVTNDNLDNNLDVGLEVVKSAQYGSYTGDTASPTTGTDQYGLYVLSSTLNVFENDTANGNVADDMYLYIVAPDTNTYTTNSCTTAVPTPAHWACS
jgi:hypothetical protein